MSPLVEEALGTLAINRAGLHVQDEDRIKLTLKALHKHGEILDSVEIESWALANGWQPKPARDITAWSKTIASGGQVRLKFKSYQPITEQQIISQLNEKLFSKSELKIAIYGEAKKFRKALLKINPQDFRFGLLSMYPANCCEFSSYLLAKYLNEFVGYKSIQMLTGENRYKTMQRHTWLKVEHIDVDITAYQFSSTKRTVIAEYSSLWHKRYRILTAEVPDLSFNQFHKEHKSDLLHDYSLIIEKLSK